MRKGRKWAFPKANKQSVTSDFLKEREEWAAERGYSKAKWIAFCEALLDLGFNVTLYEAKHTVSKYITASMGGKSFKVRFSNHRPNKRREREGDCDFFVGVNNGSTSTTDQALDAIKEFFNICDGVTE